MSPPPAVPQERTWLAWRRTAASCVVLGLLVARVAWIEGTAVTVVSAVLVLAMVGWVGALVLRGRGASSTGGELSIELVGDGRVPASVAALALAVAGVVVLLAWS